jgi:hypothetical protein
LVVIVVAGGLRPTLGAEVVFVNWEVPFTARALGDKSSFDPALWFKADRSEEDEDDVVEIEALAGYRDRFAAAPES